MRKLEQSLDALSPLDGRYGEQLDVLRPFCSEYALIRSRFLVEIHWLEALAAHPDIPEIPPLSSEAVATLAQYKRNFSPADARKVKALEAKTCHDVKALEYFIQEGFKKESALVPYIPFVHFGCTSEDINNLAYALLLQKARDALLLPQLMHCIDTLKLRAHQYADIPMIARTHGQAASPTTVGKEFANVVARLRRQCEQLKKTEFLGKCNGAVGNFNAHSVAYPDVDWMEFSQNFVTRLGLVWNAWTTQIEPHDFLAEFFHILVRINHIILDCNKDMWGYIALGYFKQKTVAQEVGSSTMPHKVNPIDFENSEGNLGIANALLAHLSEKLPISRWQRDLSDSTVLRNIGVALGHTLLAWQAMRKGIAKIAVCQARLEQDLAHSWEVLAEPIQTLMRKYGIVDAYEQIKAKTRGKVLDAKAISDLIDQIAKDLPQEARARLKALTPDSYVGLAEKLANAV